MGKDLEGPSSPSENKPKTTGPKKRFLSSLFPTRLSLRRILGALGQPQLETEEPVSTIPTLMLRSKIIRGPPVTF